MVQFVNLPQQPQSRIAEQLGQNLGQGVGNVLQQQYQRGMLQNALQQAKGMANQPGATPYDLASSLMYATTGIPGAERYVGQLFPLLLQHMQAKGTQNVDYSPQGQGVASPQGQVARERMPMEPMAQKQQMPGFIGQTPEQTNKFFPSNVGPQDYPGSMPQQATTGEKRPILNADELLAEGKRIAAQQSANQIPTTVQEGFKIAKERNDENKLYNQQVDQERQSAIASQEKYGEKASEMLTKLMPNATDEQQAIFKKIGEDVASRGKSQGEIERALAKEATKFKNTISNVEKDVSAPRFYNTLYRQFMGSDKEFNQAAKDLKIKLKPLLDLGLYDTARNLLDKKGYYPEERESVLNPLNERASTAIKNIPSGKKIKIDEVKLGPITPSLTQPYRYESNPETLKEGIMEVFKQDPKISLVLLRKGVEDKNYDWRMYKDAVNDLVSEGKIQLNDDQFNQLPYLDSPPLNTLQKVLQGLNIIGR